MTTTRDQRRKQAAYLTVNREKVRMESLRQAVSAELRRAAQESLAEPEKNVLITGRNLGLRDLEYGRAAQVTTRLVSGGKLLALYAFPISKDGRRIDTAYFLENPGGPDFRRFPSRLRGVIAAELVACGIIVWGGK